MSKIVFAAALLLVGVAGQAIGANLSGWNGVTLGTSAGNINAISGQAWGTASGNMSAWNGFAAATAAVTRTANFNSDENPLATNWSTWSDGGNFTHMRAQSGQATASTNDFWDYAAYWDADSFAANQFSAAKAYGTYFGVVVRVNGSSGYLFRMTTSGTFQVYKMPGWTQLGADYTGVSFTDGQVIRLEATGTSTTTLTPYVNGSALATRVDSSSAIESGAVGIYCNGDYSTSRLDDWAGGEL